MAKGNWAKHDWERARRLYEEEGKTFEEIGETIGALAHTVSNHAKGEGWVNRKQLLADSQVERVRTFIDEFIEQDREAIKENLAAKHSLNKRILALARRHIERLENDQLFAIQTGTKRDGTPILVDEDPVVSLSRLALTAQRVEAMDKSIADLKDGSWRVKEEKPAEDSKTELTAAQIDALLRGADQPSDEADVN